MSVIDEQAVVLLVKKEGRRGKKLKMGLGNGSAGLQANGKRQMANGKCPAKAADCECA